MRDIRGMQVHHEHVMNVRMDLCETLLTSRRRPLSDALSETSRGIYAWWLSGTLPWPEDFPAVDVSEPLYIGKAERASVGDRVKAHLGNTRFSAPRRSLTGLLIDVLPLRGHVIVRDPSKLSKFGLDPDGERLLTEWMAENVAATWVALDAPGEQEKSIIRRLLPPLNDTDAVGSAYIPPMRRLRAAAAQSALTSRG